MDEYGALLKYNRFQSSPGLQVDPQSSVQVVIGQGRTSACKINKTKTGDNFLINLNCSFCYVKYK